MRSGPTSGRWSPGCGRPSGRTCHPSADGIGYLATRPHPDTGEEAPVAFALVDGLAGDRRTVAVFRVAPPLRRTGLGAALALAVLARHPGPWRIGFQHDDVGAGVFRRRVADAAFGSAGWTETQEPVPGRPQAPPDHIIRTRDAGGGTAAVRPAPR